MLRTYGWKPALPDHRNFTYKVDQPVDLPQLVDLRSGCPRVYDQGSLGSCTANAIAGAIEFWLIKQGKKVFTPSRLFVYYNERSLENTVDQDAGAIITDGFKVIKSLGVPDETLWPYDISQFSTKPTDEVYKAAACDLIDKYEQIPDGNLFLMKQSLAKGYPFVFGFTVYEGFESNEVYQTGILQMPQPSEQMLGGHAVLCVGYDENSQRFIIRNSWGGTWGQHGYFTMPYEYMRTMASDLWTINQPADARVLNQAA